MKVHFAGRFNTIWWVILVAAGVNWSGITQTELLILRDEKTFDFSYQ